MLPAARYSPNNNNYIYIYIYNDEDGGGEWRLLGLLYADDMVLRTMVGWFVEVCKRRGLIVNAGKSKVMVMNG